MATDGSPQDAVLAYYEDMSRARKRIVGPLVAFVLVFYFTLPVLTNFTSVLDGLAFDGMTWAFIYAFAQFVMVIILTTYYRKQMDTVEHRLRPKNADETAAHYDDWQTWEKHEDELEGRA